MLKVVDGTAEFHFALEKHARGRTIGSKILTISPWQLRNFVVKGQEVSYYDGTKRKGSFSAADIKDVESLGLLDNKPFPLAVSMKDSEVVLLSASSNELRGKVMRVLTLAAVSADWSNGLSESNLLQAVPEMASESRSMSIMMTLDAAAVKEEHETKIVLAAVLPLALADFRRVNHRGDAVPTFVVQTHAVVVIVLWWRFHAARKTEARKRAILEHKAATIIQRRVRQWLAKALVRALQAERRRRTKAAQSIQQLVRRFVARRRLGHLSKHRSHVVTVKLVQVPKALLASAPKSAASGVVGLHVTVLQGVPTADAAASAGALSKSAQKTAHAMRAKAGKPYTSASSVTSPASPSYDKCRVAGVTSEGFIVLTFVDKTDCHGQCVIAMDDCIDVFSGGSVTLTLPVHEYLVPIANTAHQYGTVPSLGRSSEADRQLTVTLQAVSPAMTCGGFLWKQSESWTTDAFRKWFFLLSDRQLSYVADEHNLSLVKKILSCNDVTSIAPATVKGESVLKITFVVNSNDKEDCWYIKWDPAATDAEKAEWTTKLTRNCWRIEDPLLSTLGITKKDASITSSSAASHSEQPVTRNLKVPFKKRLSVFS